MVNSNVVQHKQPYVGRFAPSPSGPLHFGSLVCALVSYLDARSNSGKWLVRIEDIDTPRINPMYIDVILNSLKFHGLEWDDDVVLQSQRHDLYKQYLNRLNDSNLIYACDCSRRQIKARSQFYDGHCRDRGLAYKNNALRFKQISPQKHFVDKYLNNVNITHPIANEDPVLKRADSIYAYHLVVVVDDIEQGVTDIVRGNDLLEITPIHLSLYHALNTYQPVYGHIPVITQKPRQKLSKQHHSPPIDDSIPLTNLKLALEMIGFNKKLMSKITNVSHLLGWAIDKWQEVELPKQSEILISTANGVYSSFK